jgi:hypothetical protein
MSLKIENSRRDDESRPVCMDLQAAARAEVRSGRVLISIYRL